MTAILSIESDTVCERFDWKRGWLQEFRLKASANARVSIESVGDCESFDWKFLLCVFFCVWPLEFVLLRDAEHPSCTPASLALSMAARSSLSRISKLFRLQEFCFKASADTRVSIESNNDCKIAPLLKGASPDCKSFDWKWSYSSFYVLSLVSARLILPLQRDVEYPSCALSLIAGSIAASSSLSMFANWQV